MTEVGEDQAQGLVSPTGGGSNRAKKSCEYILDVGIKDLHHIYLAATSMLLGAFFELCISCSSILTSPEFVDPVRLSDSKSAQRD